MRTVGRIVLYTACIAGAVCARSVPREIGNRAHGFSYQPTQEEVRPREATLGIRPSKQRQAANDRALQRINENLLREEGIPADPLPLTSNR
jgi:hypothetical protein